MMNKEAKYLSVVATLLMSTSLVAMRSSKMDPDPNPNPRYQSVKYEQFVTSNEKARHQEEEAFCAALKEMKIREQRKAQRCTDHGKKDELNTLEKPLSFIKKDKLIPEIAKGYEDVYRMFINGKLIYKPDPNSDKGKIELPVRDLKDPLEGTFNLSRCGDSEKYLSIATGYRKKKNEKNADKIEIWITPLFFIDKNLQTTAGHLKEIMEVCSNDVASIGVFWTLGIYDNEYYNYLICNDDISSDNLYKKYENHKSPSYEVYSIYITPTKVLSEILERHHKQHISCFRFELKK